MELKISSPVCFSVHCCMIVLYLLVLPTFYSIVSSDQPFSAQCSLSYVAVLAAHARSYNLSPLLELLPPCTSPPRAYKISCSW